MGILLCQISTRLIEQHQSIDPLSTKYYETLWARRAQDGFFKPDDFWEVPPWLALLKKNIPDSSILIVRNIEEFLNHIHENEYSYICFSVLDANKEIIKKIINSYRGNATFALGGYINLQKYFSGYDTVSIFNTIEDFCEYIMGRYEELYDYSAFKKCKCIPRLELSTGCRNRCSFCTVPNRLLLKSRDVAEAQIKSFSDLDFELVYVGDKTFGQASNHIWLEKLRRKIEEINPKFRGFIIQTTPAQFLNLSPDFFEKTAIKFVEIGVETFNDKILRSYNKPSTTKNITEASNRFFTLQSKLIPNIIIGMPEENTASYTNTLDYLKTFKNVISHLGICNLAIYQNTELAKKLFQKNQNDYNELIVKKSFHKNEKAHEWFHDKLFQFGLEVLRTASSKSGLDED
jgi:hypothetical protein